MVESQQESYYREEGTRIDIINSVPTLSKN